MGRVVKAWECDKMRRRVRKFDTPFPVLAEEYAVSEDSVRYHVRGKCCCITDASPLERDRE